VLREGRFSLPVFPAQRRLGSAFSQTLKTRRRPSSEMKYATTIVHNQTNIGKVLMNVTFAFNVIRKFWVQILTAIPRNVGEFPTASRNIPVQYLKLCEDHFFANDFEFIIHQSSSQSALYNIHTASKKGTEMINERLSLHPTAIHRQKHCAAQCGGKSQIERAVHTLRQRRPALCSSSRSKGIPVLHYSVR
jgi:restriction endonuclease